MLVDVQRKAAFFPSFLDSLYTHTHTRARCSAGYDEVSWAKAGMQAYLRDCCEEAPPHRQPSSFDSHDVIRGLISSANSNFGR